MKEVTKEVEKEEVVPVHLEKIQINLAPGAGMAINYSGRQFVHGAKYEVPTPIAAAVMEIQNRGWSHESSLKESENKGRKSNRAFL